MVDEVEQVVVGPVQVLEDEHEGPALGERLEEAAPGGERLVAAVTARVALPRQPDERPQMALDPMGALGVGDEIRHRLAQLRLGRLGGVGLEDPGLRLDHLPHGPEGDALAVRERAALPPVDDQVRIRVHRLRELPHEPALADSRDAYERDELRPPLPQGARETVRQPVELLAAADERRRTALLHVDPQTRPGGDCLPDRNGLRLPLRAHRLALAVLDHPLGRPVGRLADEDPVHRRGALEPGGRVDDVAGDHALPARRGSSRGRRRPRPY